MTNIPGFHTLSLPIVQLSLAAVLKCGQSFRWRTVSVANDTEYRLCLRDCVVCLRQSPTTLFYRAIYPDKHVSSEHEALRNEETLSWLRDYFQLDIDLVKLYDHWSAHDPVFAKVQPRFKGIRILRQDPWENLVSFICSSNNNIPRITKMINALCAHFSPPLLMLPDEEAMYHPFPPPSALSEPSVSTVLRSLGFGYRANFIQRTAKMLVDAHGKGSVHDDREVSEKWLIGLRDTTTNDAREELLRFVGVGRKVADCVLLMSLDKREVVPVDTHVYQIAVRHYGFKGPSGKKVSTNPKIYDAVNSGFVDIWGDYAGWAHSVLFTSELKAFSTYGLSESKHMPSSLDETKGRVSVQDSLCRMPLPKRKTKDEKGDATTLVERAKRQRKSKIA